MAHQENPTRKRPRSGGCFSMELFMALSCVAEHSTLRDKPARSRNTHLDRAYALTFVSTWSDEMFRRQFGLCRDDFFPLVDSLKCVIRTRNVKMAERSSGSVVGVETKCLVTLRILRGGNEYDMIWYGIPVFSAYNCKSDRAFFLN